MLFFKKKEKRKKKEPEESWGGQIPGKVLMQIFSQKKKLAAQKDSIPKTQYHRLPGTISGYTYTFIRKSKKALYSLQKIYASGLYFLFQSPLKHYSNLLVLCLVYFFLWHPGLDNREEPKPIMQKTEKKAIPSRSSFSPAESVYLEIDTRNSWLNLFMNQNKIASYPVTSASLPHGHYRILRIQEYPQGMIVALAGGFDLSKTEKFILLKAESLKIDNSIYHCIELEDAFWESLHPYLRANNPMFIK
ncbi:MAG: hypothetical protein HUU50_17930 [Candidatus Brocadiae bacterium]|nr:hypothetical protein [Candidatus Brocadiia bacterium]